MSVHSIPLRFLEKTSGPIFELLRTKFSKVGLVTLLMVATGDIQSSLEKLGRIPVVGRRETGVGGSHARCVVLQSYKVCA